MNIFIFANCMDIVWCDGLSSRIPSHLIMDEYGAGRSTHTPASHNRYSQWIAITSKCD